MSSFLKIASGLLLSVSLTGCVAERVDDDPAVSDPTGEAAQADIPGSALGNPFLPVLGPAAPAAAAPCPVTPGPGGAPLPGPYACAANASGTPPVTGYYPGYYPLGVGYYPGYGYRPGYTGSYGYPPGYTPSSYGFGPGYYYPASGYYGPGATHPPNGPCGCVPH
jgi:hypothetical protein